MRFIRFFWWNLQAFAHYDVKRAGEEQWPLVPAEYAAKCDRVDKCLREFFASSPPEIMAFAEITSQAAHELRDRLFPKHTVFSLDQLPRSELQVTVLYDPKAGFEEVGPLLVPGLPRGTRAMAIVDHCSSSHRIRFFACHWTARFSDQSRHHRSDTAHYLNREIYRFLNADQPSAETRHIVILGDLNEEPYGLLEERLHAMRNRSHSRMRPHYRDKDVERIRLYNCAWRFLGERLPHTGLPLQRDTAGTYYWEKENRWGTPDQVIVNGSLLTEAAPFLDESALTIVAAPIFFGDGEIPKKFKWNNRMPTGLSDHLPIVGRIVLQREG
jgi:Endonuclease/Exonuclease/phosphatase family